jgi:uncharacterized protein (TIGR02453 family)
MASHDRSFRPALFTYLKDLAANNDREWFAENKGRYEEYVKGDGLQFIRDFEPYLHEISPHFVADPRTVGGSLFRIYRDARFSKDKTPYKTHMGIQFRHEAAKDVHAPGFYLHLEPSACFVGIGIWRPDGPALRRIRDAMADDPDGWSSVVGGGSFSDRYGLEGERLKRPPRGYDAESPIVDDLKLKDFIGGAKFSQRTATSSDFLEEYAAMCRDGAAFNRYLCGALGLPF